ncbi:unnamed protein product [Cunninghamella echinulata]
MSDNYDTSNIKKSNHHHYNNNTNNNNKIPRDHINYIDEDKNNNNKVIEYSDDFILINDDSNDNSNHKLPLFNPLDQSQNISLYASTTHFENYFQLHDKDLLQEIDLFFKS